jgi:hypothetical protein
MIPPRRLDLLLQSIIEHSLPFVPAFACLKLDQVLEHQVENPGTMRYTGKQKAVYRRFI